MAQAKPTGVVGWVQADVELDNADSEDDLEPPDFVYDKPKSLS